MFKHMARAKNHESQGRGTRPYKVSCTLTSENTLESSSTLAISKASRCACGTWHGCRIPFLALGLLLPPLLMRFLLELACRHSRMLCQSSSMHLFQPGRKFEAHAEHIRLLASHKIVPRWQVLGRSHGETFRKFYLDDCGKNNPQFHFF